MCHWESDKVSDRTKKKSERRYDTIKENYIKNILKSNKSRSRILKYLLMKDYEWIGNNLSSASASKVVQTHL